MTLNDIPNINEIGKMTRKYFSRHGHKGTKRFSVDTDLPKEVRFIITMKFDEEFMIYIVYFDGVDVGTWSKYEPLHPNLSKMEYSGKWIMKLMAYNDLF